MNLELGVEALKLIDTLANRGCEGKDGTRAAVHAREPLRDLSGSKSQQRTTRPSRTPRQ